MKEMKYMLQEVKNSFNGFIYNWTEHKKELVNLQIGQQKLSRMKHTEKKNKTVKIMEQSIWRSMEQNQMM